MGSECSVSLRHEQALRNFDRLAMRYQMLRMPTIDEIRRGNLEALVQELGGNKALAETVGVSESQMNQWVNGAKESKTGKARGMRLASCHRIEDATGKPRGWLDTLHKIAETHELGKPGPGFQAPMARSPSLREAMATLADAIQAVPRDARPALQPMLLALVLAPDSRELREDLAITLAQLATPSDLVQRAGFLPRTMDSKPDEKRSGTGG